MGTTNARPVLRADTASARPQFIDSGVVYGNEPDIGKALTEELKNGSVKREDLYICSKLNSDQHSEEGAYKAVKESLG